MPAVLSFKILLLSLTAIIALELLAKRLRLPPAAALLVGGISMAFVPGLPVIDLDPEFVLLVFLPPLLMDGAYFVIWDEFKRHITGVFLLAVGAVIFTTLLVGWVTHWLMPALPWGACFALGAILSPPDAVAGKAVLERVRLPREVMVLLEGESMLNDASGLVLFRFSVASVLTGVFSWSGAAAEFSLLFLGGCLVGATLGWLIVALLRYLSVPFLAILATAMGAWVSYLAGETAGVSGVIATVAYSMVLGRHQHEVVSATVRIRGTAFWQVMIFVLESLIFILIGLSLRGVVHRIGGIAEAWNAYGMMLVGIVATTVIARFVWIFVVDGLAAIWNRAFDWRNTTVKSWAGMRGVVTLAVALSLPTDFPGHDLIILASFAVILVTVLLQGTTLGPLICLLKLNIRDERLAGHISEPEGWARIEAAQFEAVKERAYDERGRLIHPRLLEQYGYRARVSNSHRHDDELPVEVRQDHYDIVLAAVAAGRREMLDLHREGKLSEVLLAMLEHDLDLQEVVALHSRGE